METLKAHLQKKEFSHVYLLYGEEAYLKRYYRNSLQKAILGDADLMNLSNFLGKDIDAAEVEQIAQTMPFFAEHRVIVIEDSGWFKTEEGGAFASVLHELPDTTYIIFSEREMNKRSRLYKAITEIGTAAECTAMNRKDLRTWIGTAFGRNAKAIAAADIDYLIDRVGSDMELLTHEIEKLSNLSVQAPKVTRQDIDAMCAEHLDTKVFALTDLLAGKQTNEVMACYRELTAMQERPLGLLALLSRQFGKMVSVIELGDMGVNRNDIMARLSITNYVFGKYTEQIKKLGKEAVKDILKLCVSTETAIKTGDITDQIGFEIIVVKLASM